MKLYNDGVINDGGLARTRSKMIITSLLPPCPGMNHKLRILENMMTSKGKKNNTKQLALVARKKDCLIVLSRGLSKFVISFY